MKQYTYSATVKGEKLDFNDISALVEKINEAYDFPIVSTYNIYNYFSRPGVMKNKVKKLAVFELARTPR